jgi:hypothetical protein
MSPKKSGRSPGNPAAGTKRIGATTGLGMSVEAAHRHHASIDWQPGQHLWTVLGMWKVRPEHDQFLLDTENLLTIEGPGCYVCEQEYTPERAAQPCPGDPSGMMERRS